MANLTNQVSTTTPLPSPSNISVSLSSTVDITWQNNDNSSDGSVFVERSDDGGSTFSSVSGSLPIGTTSYSEQPPAGQGSAEYRVARSTDHTTSRSNAVTIQLLQQVTNLTADTITETSISLSWTDTNESESGYRVFISSDGGSTFTQDSGDLSSNTTSYTINGLTAGETYLIKVDSFNSSTSVSSQIITATTNFIQPSNLSVTDINKNSADINWTDNSNAESGYRVLISSDGGSTFTQDSGELSPNTTSYTINGLTAGETYSIRVDSFNSSTSVSSQIITATTNFIQPSNLSASNITNTSVDINWLDNSNAESGYRVFISSDDGSTFTQDSADLSTNTTSYTINGLTAGETYSIKVAAFSTASSVESNTVTFTTTFDPPENISSQLSNGFNKGIDLNWQIPDTNPGGSVRILRRESGQTSFTEIASLDPSVTTYTDTTFPTRGNTYEYKIRRIIQSSFEDSVTTSVTTLAKPTIDFTVKNTSIAILELSFVPPQAESVEVYKSTTSGDVVSDYTLLQTVQPPFDGTIVDQNSGNREDHYRIAAIAGNTKVLSDEVLAEKVGNFSTDNQALDIEQTLGQYDI